jgi:hypothetical protein
LFFQDRFSRFFVKEGSLILSVLKEGTITSHGGHFALKLLAKNCRREAAGEGERT